MASTETSTRVTAVKRGYEAFQTGDMDTMRQVLAADVSWHSRGQGPGSGDFQGVDDVIAEFGRLFQESGGTFRVAVDEILEGDHNVVVLAHAHATRDGKTLDERYAHIFNFRGEQVSEAWVVNYNQAASAAFWA
jgi:ketosteroid isomerase-like protein